jgi:hypothetical protein
MTRSSWINEMPIDFSEAMRAGRSWHLLPKKKRDFLTIVTLNILDESSQRMP